MPGKFVDREKAFIVHPAIQDAYLNYKGDKSSFQEVFDAWKKGELPIENDDYALMMAEIAEMRTVAASTHGEKIPERKQ